MKLSMKKFSLIIPLLLAITIIKGQEIKNLYPNQILSLNLSAEGEKTFNANKKKCDELWKRDTESLSASEKGFRDKCDETVTSYWDIIGGGCSWYCGGGPYEVSASSALLSQGTNSYAATNAHDLNYQTAWVEGIKGYGIGEFLLYAFEPSSPRITKIIVVNGYVKSESAWQNNSRVKKLKLYLNNQPHAILNLEDKRARQVFEVGPLGHGDRADAEKLKNMPAWSLRFEILEVYEGEKYDDVVITEIYFDGIDVH